MPVSLCRLFVPVPVYIFCKPHAYSYLACSSTAWLMCKKHFSLPFLPLLTFFRQSQKKGLAPVNTDRLMPNSHPAQTVSAKTKKKGCTISRSETQFLSLPRCPSVITPSLLYRKEQPFRRNNTKADSTAPVRHTGGRFTAADTHTRYTVTNRTTQFKHPVVKTTKPIMKQFLLFLVFCTSIAQAQNIQPNLSFGEGGIVKTNLTGPGNEFNEMALKTFLLPDGKLLSTLR